MKAMEYTPPYEGQLNGKPTLCWGTHPVCFVFEHETEAHLENKRLTDAECAAEYWRAFTIFNAVASGGIAGDPIAANHQLDVWHRFATTPHAFEGGY